jgi:hypothetical protein
MKVRVALIVVTVVAAALSAFTLHRAHATLAATRTRIEAAEARRTRAATATHDAWARLRAVRAAKTDFSRSVGASGKAAGSSERAKPMRDWNADAKQFEARIKDPTAQVTRLAVAKMQLRQKFGPLYRKLGLPPDKIAAVEDVEAASDEKNQDIYYAALSQHLSNDDPVLRDLYTAAWRERVAAEKSVLGNDGYKEFTAYQRTLPIQEFVASFDGLATVAGEPLNEAQKQQLIAAVGQAIPGFDPGKKVPANMMDVDWSRVDTAATAILSPMQLELLQTQDPPTHSGGGGGRFWAALNKALHEAQKAETNAGAATTAASTP